MTPRDNSNESESRPSFVKSRILLFVYRNMSVTNWYYLRKYRRRESLMAVAFNLLHRESYSLMRNRTHGGIVSTKVETHGGQEPFWICILVSCASFNFSCSTPSVELSSRTRCYDGMHSHRIEPPKRKEKRGGCAGVGDSSRVFLVPIHNCKFPSPYLCSSGCSHHPLLGL